MHLNSVFSTLATALLISSAYTQATPEDVSFTLSDVPTTLATVTSTASPSSAPNGIGNLTRPRKFEPIGPSKTVRTCTIQLWAMVKKLPGDDAYFECRMTCEPNPKASYQDFLADLVIDGRGEDRVEMHVGL